VPVVLGIGLILYSLITNYELGVFRVLPMAGHNVLDITAGVFLAASPWIFGFADESANVWVPHVAAGIAAVVLGLVTEQHPRWEESAHRDSRSELRGTA
jgi:SPW repeat-containing protein